jgi:S1-C subfamily serine protease
LALTEDGVTRQGERQRRRGVALELGGAFCLVLTLAGPIGAASPAAAKMLPLSREQVTFSFAPVVKRVAPAVVNIYTRTVVEQPKSALFSDPFFRRFFGDDAAGGAPQRRIEQALG